MKRALLIFSLVVLTLTTSAWSAPITITADNLAYFSKLPSGLICRYVQGGSSNQLGTVRPDFQIGARFRRLTKAQLRARVNRLKGKIAALNLSRSRNSKKTKVLRRNLKAMLNSSRICRNMAPQSSSSQSSSSSSSSHLYTCDQDLPPRAEPGANIIVQDSDQDGRELVSLNASGSSDADGSLIEYKWTENGLLLSRGLEATANVSVDLGQHLVELQVTDNCGLSDKRTLSVTVERGSSCPNSPEIQVGSTEEISTALASATGCETLLLASGQYSDLTISGKHFSNYVTLRSANPLAPATFQTIRVLNSSYLRFQSIFLHHIRQPDESDWSRAFEVSGGHHFQLLDSELSGSVDENYSNDIYGFVAGGVNYLLVENNDFHDFIRGSVTGGGDHITYRGNSYHNLRSDGADFAGLVDALVENNRFTDSFPCCGDHPDHIQFWNDNGTRNMRDVVIRGNLSLRGTGEVSQLIFIQSNSPSYPNQNFTIEKNVLYGGHIHGISISGTDGVLIQHNTVLADHAPALIPSINTGGSTNALVRNNVSTAYGLDPATTVSEGNITAQNANPDLATHYDKLFNSAQNGPTAQLEDFRPRPGSILIRNPEHDIGALEYNPNQPQLTCILLTDLESGIAPLSVHFDAVLSGGPAPIVTHQWNFGDSSTAQGALVDHVFQVPGAYQVELIVTDSSNSQASCHKRISVIPAPIADMALGINFDGHILDFSEYHALSEWHGAESYGAGISGQAIHLDGTTTGPYITVPHHSALDGMNQMTIAFFAKKDAPATGGGVLNKHVTYAFWLGEDNLGGYVFNSNGTRYDVSYSATPINNSEWHHYAITTDGATLRTYLDGSEVKAQSFEGSIAVHPDRDIVLGRDPWGPSFAGSIDEFRIYRRALSQAEILALSSSR